MSARWGTRSSRSAMDPPIPMYPAQVSMYNALKPDVAGLSHSSKEEAVREHYLSSTGLQTALRDAIKSLFMESKLPANPYYYLADVLSTYVDQSPTWMMSDEELMEPYGVEGMVDVVDSSNRLCKNNNSTHAYGLPHVIRLTNKRGINSLHAILTEQLPDSFFPTSQPFTLSEEDFMIQAMCSVQGMNAMWHPDRMHLSQLDIRADILIKGPSLEEAVRLFLDLLVHDVEDLMDIPVYFVTGVDFEDVASKPLDANGQRDKFVQNVPIEQIYSDPDGFDRDGQRLILGNKCAKINLVAMLDEGGRAAYDSVRTHPENATLRYKMVTKTYYFHYSSLEESKLGFDQLSHYGSLPYEALFEGYFADKAAAKHYMGMYVGTKSESRLPYWDDNRVPNIEVLVNQVNEGIYSDGSLSAFRQLLLLTVMQDSSVTKLGILNVISSLDDVALGAQRSKREGNGREEDQILSTIPNLLRIICSAANTLRGYAHEMEALHIASEKWPAKFAFLKATASNKPGHTPLLREDGLYSAPGTGDSRRTLRTPEVSDAMLVWLKTVDMNARLVGQLIQLKKGITASTGKRLFSGCSVILQLMFGIVPDEVPPMGSAHIVSTMQRVSVHAVSLLHVLALTVSHGFLARCQDVLWALKAMEMNLKSRLDRVLMGVELIEDDPMIPEWELDVVDAVGSQVNLGGLAARVGVEGVMLQYAVDTKLDELLSVLWHQATQPPMPINPFPRLMLIIRSRAAKMELWNEEEEDVIQVLMNDLTMWEAPMWMYSGCRSQAAVDKLRKQNVGITGQHVHDDTDTAVFGSYAAVSLADAKTLQVMNNNLPGLFTERHWQRGAYMAEVIPSLIGDAWMTNAMGLSDLVTPAMFKAGYKYRPSAPYEHPRFFTTMAEEHHLVNGPKRKDAAHAFATEVVDSLLKRHETTTHLVHHLCIASESKDLDFMHGLSTAPLAAKARPSTASKAPKTKRYKISDMKDEGKKALVIDDLAQAARKMPQGSHVGYVQLYVSSQTQMYVSIKLWLTFQYTKVAPQLQLHISVTRNARADSRDGKRPSTADRDLQYWDRFVYQRVFLTEFCAKTWYAWNRDRGDPSQPFHYQRMVAKCLEEIKELHAKGDVLEMLKLLLLCATANQDDGGIYRYSRVCLSTSQELKVLMEMNLALIELMGEDMDPLVAEKMENEQLRRNFLCYYNRLGRAMRSPKYCYFSGMNTLVPVMLEDIRKTVVSEFKLKGKLLQYMVTLNVWTKACESSVASALHDTFIEAATTQATLHTHGGW